MRLYIKLDENLKPVDHPIIESNMRFLFPQHNFDNGPPTGFSEFLRIPKPFPDNPYVRVGEVEYVRENDKIRDNWPIIELTNEEIKALQDEVKANWAANFANIYPSHIFEEETCTFIPPVPKPKVGKWAWRESDTSWVSIPTMPNDGKRYNFDIESGQWILASEE